MVVSGHICTHSRVVPSGILTVVDLMGQTCHAIQRYFGYHSHALNVTYCCASMRIRNIFSISVSPHLGLPSRSNVQVAQASWSG